MEPWQMLNYAMKKIDKVFEEARKMSPTERTAAMSRDNFDPYFILVSLKEAQILETGELARLLAEACHVIARQNTQLENARRKVSEMWAMIDE